MKVKERYFHAIIIVICTSFLSSVALADSLNIAIGYQENSNGTTSRPQAIKFIKDINKNIDADILFQNSKTVDQYELGARYKFPKGLYVRGLIGNIASTNNYIGTEVGFMFKPVDRIGVRADHTIISGLNTSKMDTNFTRVWLSYDVTSDMSFAIRRDWMRKDIDFDAWRLLVQYRF